MRCEDGCDGRNSVAIEKQSRCRVEFQSGTAQNAPALTERGNQLCIMQTFQANKIMSQRNTMRDDHSHLVCRIVFEMIGLEYYNKHRAWGFGCEGLIL